MLTARKQLLGKQVDLEGSTRGILRGFGLKVGALSRGRFLQRIRDLIDGHALLQQVIEPILAAREALRREVNLLHRQLVAIAKDDPVCRRLMSTPGVGALVALTYISGVDDPNRFSSSRSLGPDLGLTARRYQSGETDIAGRISRAGDAMARSALYEAATVILTRAIPLSPLKRWALDLAGPRGVQRARVALARKLSVILHRMWVDGTSSQAARRTEGSPRSPDLIFARA